MSPDFEDESDRKNGAHHIALSPIEQISADDTNNVPCRQSRGSIDMLISLSSTDAYRTVLADDGILRSLRCLPIKAPRTNKAFSRHDSNHRETTAQPPPDDRQGTEKAVIWAV